MYAAIRNVLLVFAALLPIVNPLGMAPIFAEMTLPYPEAVRRTVAMRVALNGIALLVASLFVGEYILDFFGISLAAVQVGGGLVVTFAGWRILNKSSDIGERVADSPRSDLEILSQAFYPLTMPLTVGPGSIAVALTLGSNLHEERQLQLIFSGLTAVIGIALIGLTIFLCYWGSERLQRFLGPTGTSILIRLSAFLVLCIGIQIMFNGLKAFYQLLRHANG
ncbi:MAG TPA: MarC family protein [Verrucomicrobiae bacterium]|jgi:multiple antibiotic resistance protein|nr:MarC family protein [Verrucomicrobiae bacterium]